METARAAWHPLCRRGGATHTMEVPAVPCPAVLSLQTLITAVSL